MYRRSSVPTGGVKDTLHLVWSRRPHTRPVHLVLSSTCLRAVTRNELGSGYAHHGHSSLWQPEEGVCRIPCTLKGGCPLRSSWPGGHGLAELKGCCTFVWELVAMSSRDICRDICIAIYNYDSLTRIVSTKRRKWIFVFFFFTEFNRKSIVILWHRNPCLIYYAAALTFGTCFSWWRMFGSCV